MNRFRPLPNTESTTFRPTNDVYHRRHGRASGSRPPYAASWHRPESCTTLSPLKKRMRPASSDAQARRLVRRNKRVLAMTEQRRLRAPRRARSRWALAGLPRMRKLPRMASESAQRCDGRRPRTDLLTFRTPQRRCWPGRRRGLLRLQHRLSSPLRKSLPPLHCCCRRRFRG